MLPSYFIFMVCLSLCHQTTHGKYYRNFLNEASLLSSFDATSADSNTEGNSFDTSSSETYLYDDDASESRLESSPSDVFITNGTSSETDQTNSTSSASDSSPTGGSVSSIVPLSTHDVSLSEIFGNESQSSSPAHHSTSVSSSGSVTGGGLVTTHSVISSSTLVVNGSSSATQDATDEVEPEGVARGKPSTAESVNATTSLPENLYQRALDLITDTYTLSILVPVTAGVLFATTIIMTIACCRCLRRRCRRRRLRKKVLPDSVRNLRPSDRARLLAESSDEEF